MVVLYLQQNLNFCKFNSHVTNVTLIASFSVTSVTFFAYILKHDQNTFSLLSLLASSCSAVFDDFNLSGVNVTPKQFGILFF